VPIYIGTTGTEYDVSNDSFAGGGEGSIHTVVNYPLIVAKIFNENNRTTERERKISAMVKIHPDFEVQYSWPMDIIYENGKFAGYVMPKVTGKERLRNIYVYDERTGVPWPVYLAIAKNLSVAIHNVHNINQVIGDLNPVNILVGKDTGYVTLVDTDSYHITDDKGNTYRCAVAMPEFIAPELQGAHFPSEPLPTFTKETDLFALAELIFALLMNGAHPFACKVISCSASKFQPVDNLLSGTCAYFPVSTHFNIDIPRYAPDLDSLPEDVREMFFRALIHGHKDPSIRPSAEEWYYTIERLEKNITKCKKDATHFYYNQAPECPWCKVEEKMGNISKTVFQTPSDITSQNFKPSTFKPSNPNTPTVPPQPQPQPKPQPPPQPMPPPAEGLPTGCSVFIFIAIIASIIFFFFLRGF